MYDEKPIMKYEYTNIYEDEEERLLKIAEDILIEYPRLGVVALKAATMEEPFGAVHEDYSWYSEQENHINRLINIIIVTEGKKSFVDEYNKACEDLIANYAVWKDRFTYANPEDQPPYYIMTSFYAHKKNKDIPLMTYKQAKEEIRRRAEEKDLEALSNRLRYEIPSLGPIADQVAYLETANKTRITFDEVNLNRLVTIIKLTENNPNYQEAFDYALNKLAVDFEEWLNVYSRYSNNANAITYMIDILRRHFNGEDVDIATLYELLDENESLEFEPIVARKD